MKSQRGVAAVQLVWIIAGVLAIVAGLWQIATDARGAFVRFPTRYEAVVLMNSAVYFGHLQGYGGAHPVLTDVYYIISQTDPTTKEVKNVLIKRGKELHEPDRMYLNPAQILFVEPVGTNSKVAQLIAQAQSGK